MKRQVAKYAWVIFFIVSILAFIVFFVAKLPDVPLEALVIDTGVLPPGWEISKRFPPLPNNNYGATEGLIIILENDDIPPDHIATTFVEIDKYDYPIMAMYWYKYLTSRAILPREIYYDFENSNNDEIYANQVYFVCQWPSAGYSCRADARYGQYVITFQLDFYGQPREGREASFQALWEEVDKHVGEVLNQAQK